MMRRIVTIGFAFGLALAPVALSAQGRGVAARRGGPGGPHSANAAERVLAHKAELGLTAAQVTQLEQIRDRVKAQNEPLLQQLAAARPQARHGVVQGLGRGMPLMRGRGALVSPERREALRDSVRSRMEARRAELSKLTPEQRAQLRDTVRARVQARRPGMHLLTPEQRSQLRDNARAMIQSRREELQKMTPEQRTELRKQQQERMTQVRNQAEALRPVVKQLHENVASSRKEVEGVLTSEQLAKLQSLRGRRGGAPPR